MAVFDLFSKRQKRARGEVPDVFTYDDIPEQLRVQIIHIIQDAIGKDFRYERYYAKNAYKLINDILCREYGLFELSKYSNSLQESILKFFLACEDNDQVLDVIELSFKIINTYVSESGYQYDTDTKIKPGEAIEELNQRFKEHGIGYQFESNELIRVDSKYLHSEVVKPVLIVLQGKMYKGANDEFLKAHEHYRHGRNKECLNECLKSLESTMKAICDKHKWKYNNSDTAKKLLDICFTNNLIPSYMQTQFSSLRALLESGTPTVRNKLGGHGQGSTKTKVSNHVASYALHLTASNLLFLTENEKTLNNRKT